MSKSRECDFNNRLHDYPVDALPFPRKKKNGGKQSLMLVSCRAASKLTTTLPPIAKGAPLLPVAVWPSKQKRAVGTSKAPFAVQLEAFVRNEHRLYAQEHKDCTHRDTIHIIREAFSVLIEHFVEYTGIFSLIRDEYEATFQEMWEEVKRIRALNLENESDRSLHAMELMRQRETLSAIISNQQAQLQASQGLAHSLRDQLAVMEETNIVLQNNLDQKTLEHREAVETSKLLANSMRDEAARTSYYLDLYHSSELEVARLILQVNNLKENYEDAESRFRVLSKQVILGNVNSGVLKFCAQAEESESASKEEPTEKESQDPSVSTLQQRIDDLMFAYEELSQKVTQRQKELNEDAEVIKPSETPKESNESIHTFDAVTTSRLIQSWLQEESLTEDALDTQDFLLPPGHCEEDPLGFLKLCRPIRNRHLAKKNVVALFSKFWRKRESQRQTPFKQFLLKWLREETGSESSAQDIGFNALYICQKNLDDPDCRGMILVLRSFLPEEMIITWKKILRDLKKVCSEAFQTVNDMVETSFVIDALRHVAPEWSYMHILRLRMYLWRLSEGSGKVNLNTLFAEDSHFVYLVKKQFLSAVEEFTLQVVETVRAASKDAMLVKLQDVTEIIGGLDMGMNKGTLHRIVAEAAQMTAMDVATTDSTFTVRLQPLLRRLRSAVLLRRSTPPIEKNDFLIAS